MRKQNTIYGNGTGLRHYYRATFTFYLLDLSIAAFPVRNSDNSSDSIGPYRETKTMLNEFGYRKEKGKG